MEKKTASLVKVDTALESMRDAGFDLSAAIGEGVDNSIQAGAHNIMLNTGFKKGLKNGLKEIIISDDGEGIKPEILPNVLTMGYSTRYNSREGMGRFGVGMKIAGISVGRKIEVYTKVKNDSNIYYVCIDLDDISSGTQEEIKLEVKNKLPKAYEEVSTFKKLSDSGTVVIWSKIDRIVHGGKYGNSIEREIDDLTKFLGRAYRYFLDKGLKINLDGKEIATYDPLFILDNPRVTKIVGEDVKAKVIDRETVDIDGYKVEMTVTLLPEVFRMVQGEGAMRGSAAKFKPLNIHDSQGKISIVRQGREIAYNIVPRLLEDGVDIVDRFIGIEMKFPAELDEYFQVRHVKRGAEPIDKLRQHFKEWLIKPMKSARTEIRDFWHSNSDKEKNDKDEHADAIEAAIVAEETTPKGRGGKDITEEEKQEIINNVIEDLGVNKEDDPEKAKEIAEKIEELPFTIVNKSWPGKEIIDIDHLNGKAIIRMNRRHPFFKKVYSKLEMLTNEDISGMKAQEIAHEIRIIKAAVDALFLGYAKAENMESNPDEAYGELRTFWGTYTSAYISELIKNLQID